MASRSRAFEVAGIRRRMPARWAHNSRTFSRNPDACFTLCGCCRPNPACGDKVFLATDLTLFATRSFDGTMHQVRIGSIGESPCGTIGFPARCGP